MSELSEAAESILGFFLAHFTETGLAGLNIDVYEIALKLHLDSIETNEAILELQNAGILNRKWGTKYVYIRKSYLEKEGLIAGISNNNNNGKGGVLPSREGVLLHGAHLARGGQTPATQVIETSWIRGVEFNPPVRIHRVVFYGKLDALATVYLREQCQSKGKDEQWWTGSLPHGSFRVSPFGGLQLYPQNYDSATQFCEEFANTLKLGKQKGDLTLFGEFAYRATGDRLDEIRKGRCKLELRNYTIEIFFDKSFGQEAEHKIRTNLSGDIEAAKEMSLSLAVPAYLTEKILDIQQELTLTRNTQDAIYAILTKQKRKYHKKTPLEKGWIHYTLSPEAALRKSYELEAEAKEAITR